MVSEPAHLFSSLIQPQILMQLGATPAIIPDLMATVSMPEVATRRGQRTGPFLPQRRLLFDVKTTHAGHGMYLTPRAREEYQGAVGERAHRVAAEYRSHAQELDRQHSPPGTTPIEDRLGTFSTVRSLVFGAHGDASGDVYSLLTSVARRRAQQQWRALGARSEREAHGAIMGGLRRFVGVASMREFARHRLRRLPLVGVPRAMLDERRQALRGGRRVVVQGRAERPFSAREFYAFQAHAAIGLMQG